MGRGCLADNLRTADPSVRAMPGGGKIIMTAVQDTTITAQELLDAPTDGTAAP